MTHRLLDVDVLASLASPDGQQGVPMVRSGDGDGIEILVLQGRANVLEKLRFPTGLLFHVLGGVPPDAGIGVDQVGKLDVLEPRPCLDVFPSAAVEAGDANPDPLIGPQDVAQNAAALAGDGSRSRQGLAQELST